jgi:molybdopterin converting factor small subunit
VYVIGAASLVTGTFARFLHEDMPGAPVLPLALAGWNKTLSLHLHMMLLGYHSARDLEQGELALPVAFFGRLRALAKTSQLSLHLNPGQSVEAALRKLFNYYPHLREVVCDIAWDSGERVDENGKPWLVVERAYRVRPGWRLLVNGREVTYHGGLERVLQAGDELQLFPPGR